MRITPSDIQLTSETHQLRRVVHAQRPFHFKLTGQAHAANYLQQRFNTLRIMLPTGGSKTSAPFASSLAPGAGSTGHPLPFASLCNELQHKYTLMLANSQNPSHKITHNFTASCPWPRIAAGIIFVTF